MGLLHLTANAGIEDIGRIRNSSFVNFASVRIADRASKTASQNSGSTRLLFTCLKMAYWADILSQVVKVPRSSQRAIPTLSR